MRDDPDGDPGDRLGTELSDAVVAFHEALGSLLGISAADHKALGLIGRSGPLAAGELAAALGLTAGAITGTVDRLEAAGLVRRVRDDVDRRRIVIERTAPPNERFLAAVGELKAAMAEVTARFTPEQLAVIGDWVVRTTEVLREQTIKITRASDDAKGG